MMPLTRTCREVATLLVTREDRHLGMADRLALRIHMSICEACPRFERQMLLLRNGLHQWRSYRYAVDSADDPTDLKIN